MYNYNFNLVLKAVGSHAVVGYACAECSHLACSAHVLLYIYSML